MNTRTSSTRRTNEYSLHDREYSPRQSRGSIYPDAHDYQRDNHRLQGSSVSKLDREDIIRDEYNGSEGEYWDHRNTDYYAGEYSPDHDYKRGTDPGHVHQPYQESEHRYAHERWARSRYGSGGGLGEYRRDRAGDYERGLEAQYPEKSPWPEEEGMDRYYQEDFYVSAPEYYRERYMPKEDTLKRLYERMFRNIEYNLKVPVMQLIATGALFFIFILNYMINIEYVIALGNFSTWVQMQPPAVAAILGAVFGIFLYLFPNMEQDIRRTVMIGTIVLLIFFFAGPAFFAGISSQSSDAIGAAFVGSIIEFLKLTAVLVYWAPMFLGIYGIWSRNSFFVGTSAMFIFLIIIILDIYLFYEGLEITKIKTNWHVYAVFSLILFCYIEMSDSAITFANFTSIRDKGEIDPGYYEHLDRILQKYFVYFVLFTAFLIILAWITISFSDVVYGLGSTQVAESLELTSIYGIMISLIVIGIFILILGLFIRNEGSFRQVYNRLSRSLKSQTPSYSAVRRRPTPGFQRNKNTRKNIVSNGRR